MTATSKTTNVTPEQEYKKQVNRIKSAMNRLGKDGYFWEKSPIPKQPKTITEKSVERLKKINPDKLRKKGEFVVPETGEVISGRRGITYEKKKKNQAKKEAQKKRKEKKKELPNPKQEEVNKQNTPPVEDETYDYDGYDPSIDTEEGKPDLDNAYNFPEDETYFDLRQSTVVLDQVRDIIEHYVPNSHWSIDYRYYKMHLRNVMEALLRSALDDEGTPAVAYRLERYGSTRIITLVHRVLYDSNSTEEVQFDVSEFATILNGGPLDSWYANHIADMCESIEYSELPE